jgi:predicted membrane-bound spermidine synthase
LVWFRVITLLLKDSPYAFSTMLATYLFCIAFGSLLSERFVVRYAVSDLGTAFFAMNGAIALATLAIFLLVYQSTGLAATQSMLRMLQTERFMIMPVMPDHLSVDAFGATAISFVVTLTVPAILMVIPTLMMGAAFPVLSALSARTGLSATSAATRIYLVMTAGNVLGGVVTGFILLRVLGTEHTLAAFIAVGLAFLLFCSVSRSSLRIAQVATIVVSAAALIVLFPGRGAMIRSLHAATSDPLHISEGVDGIVLTEGNGPKVWSYINGSGHGFRPNPNFYLMTFKALSYLDHPDNVLIIGLGGASTLEAVLKDERVKRVTVVELSAPLISNLEQIEITRSLLRDPRVTPIHDDGRRWLYGHAEKFDAVMLDPLRSESAYSNNLYSREFFSLVRTRMKADGVMVIWSDEWVTLPRTIASAFPAVDLYCWFMVAKNNLAAEMFDRHQYDALMATFPPETIAPIAKYKCPKIGDRVSIIARHPEAPLNTDLRPITEYYLTSRGRDLIAGIDPSTP